MMCTRSGERFGRWLVLAAICSRLGIGCGGSTTTSADHGGAAGSGAGGSAGGSAGSTGTPVQLFPGSWQMTALITASAMNPGVSLCDRIQFTLNVSADGRATIGKDGFMDGTRAETKNGIYTLGGLGLPCQTVTTVSGLTLQGADTDGDGNADALSGVAEGMAFSGGGDLVASESVRIELSGTPDVSGPSLVVPTVPVNPLVPWTLGASEPLAPNASLTLAAMPSVTLTGVPERSSADNLPLDAVIQWSTNLILPLSGQWPILGTAEDLSGHGLTPMDELRTLADPGVFARDGFEGPLVAASVGGTAAIVTAVGSVSAISGAHSLWLEPGSAVTFHLKRAATENSVRFSARAFGSFGGTPGFNVDIRAGVIGGQTVVTPTGYTLAESSVDTGVPSWGKASEVKQFSLPLSEPGTEVLLYLSPIPCFGLCIPPSALLIDDLTLE